MDYDYQSYFDPDLVFEDDRPRRRRDSHEKFYAAGFSDSEACDLVASGFDVLSDQLVVDRYYGGPIMSFDLRTRFPLEQFRALFGRQPNRLTVRAVTSVSELFALIERLQAKHNHRLLFRGQIGHYSIRRTIPNPTFVNGAIGETSLLPSVWRRVLKHRPNVWHQFRNLTMYEWSTIIYHLFDMRSVQAQERSAGFPLGIYSVDDLPDSPTLKPIRDFHLLRQAFFREYGMGGGDIFLTLLQHYGLYSPVLDLTADPEVALFFATHKFVRHGATCSYTFNGTNLRQAIIYVFYHDHMEMLQYERTEMLERLDPQRPKRQSCVVMPSNQFSMNIAGDLLVAAYRLDFDMTVPGRYNVADLFPSDKDDLMLAAFKSETYDSVRADLTDFVWSA